MKKNNQRDAGYRQPTMRPIARSIVLAGCVSTMFGASNLAFAQAETNPESDNILLEEVVVTGIRSSLESALAEKRASDSLIEVIVADDIGKLPDQNLAEVLENITGIQITRQAGVGTGVQIRGTNANRTELNGVATVGSGSVPLGSSGSDRSGIGFEDINASIIASVEVTKSPEAKTVEGSVGGTVNLKTIRPLDLKETLGSIRIQGEDSSLSTESIQPRLSGAFGDNWDTSIGRVGFVISGSYTEQEAVSFRPRADRDGSFVANRNVTEINSNGQEQSTFASAQDFNFQGIQFLIQEQENDDFETTNLATTFEWEPNENLNFYFDAFINEQERSRDQYRVQASGVSNLLSTAETTRFGSSNIGVLGGVDFGTIATAEAGRIGNLADDSNDPNFRVSSETNSRVTDTEVFTLGSKWESGAWSGKVEIAFADSETRTPQLSTTTNFLNPNAPLTNLDANGNPTRATDNDNAVPFIFDLGQGEGLAFGIDFDSPFAPTVDQFFDPANYTLDQIIVQDNRQELSDDQLRIDLSYAFENKVITSVDLGYRYNNAEQEFNGLMDTVGGFSDLEDSPSGALFAELLVAGPNNFASGDGRTLAVTDFLLVDPDRSFSDPEGTIAIFDRALAEHRANNPEADGDVFVNLQPNLNNFSQIEEETNALYVQGNFEYGIFRGNVGVRYIETELDSTAFGPTDSAGNRQLQTTSGDYDFLLPRINIVANVAEDVLVRFGYGSDIRRPDFRNLGTGFTLNQNENTVVRLGNADLEPEEVDSFDLGVEWYFAPSAVASIGYFRKERESIFGTTTVIAPFDANGFRSADPSCPGGGLFNPGVVPNILGDPNTQGLCVDFSLPANSGSETTQDGIEVAFQYDLSSFEDKLGWASGFGIIANASFQDFDESGEGGIIDSSGGRGVDLLNAQATGEFDARNFQTFTAERGLLDFSETAYNITLFYEKYGLSARARYTWREAFRTLDFAGGAGLGSTLGFPVVTEDRGQLNASVAYDLTDKINLSVEAVNLTEEGVTQNCLTEGGFTCFVGIPDRRITFGASYRF